MQHLSGVRYAEEPDPYATIKRIKKRQFRNTPPQPLGVETRAQSSLVRSCCSLAPLVAR